MRNKFSWLNFIPMNMKFILTSLFLSCLSMLAWAQLPNQRTPRNTLEEVFKCARTQNYEYIHLLCDPEAQNDGDTKRICELNTSSRALKKEYHRFFKLAYSLPEQRIEGAYAEIAFMFGPKAQQKESMKLVKRKDKWYLSSF